MYSLPQPLREYICRVERIYPVLFALYAEVSQPWYVSPVNRTGFFTLYFQ